MERLILDYTATGQHTLTINNAAEYQSFTKDNIRLIIDCTTQEVIVSPLDRTALSAVAYNGTTKKLTITLTASSAPLTVNGEVTVKVDTGVQSAGGDATKANQQKMMAAFNMADEMPELVALTDTEIINSYDGYEDEGEHIEGIADTAFGHRRPVQVTIDEVTHTFYQERTYSDYGYSVLYRNGVAIDTTTTHPAENDVLTTSVVES